MKKIFTFGDGSALVGVHNDAVLLIQLSEPLGAGQAVSIDRVENELYRTTIDNTDELLCVKHLLDTEKSFYMNVNDNLIIDFRNYTDTAKGIVLMAVERVLSLNRIQVESGGDDDA